MTALLLSALVVISWMLGYRYGYARGRLHWVRAGNDELAELNHLLDHIDEEAARLRGLINRALEERVPELRRRRRP